MMNDTSQSPSVTVSIGTSVASSGAVATGTLETVNQYAPLFGLILSVISILLGCYFFYISDRRNKESMIIRQKYHVRAFEAADLNAEIKVLKDKVSKLEGDDHA